MDVLGAAIDIGRPTRYVDWGWVKISVPNLLVIVLMVAVLALAIAIPFPGRHR